MLRIDDVNIRWTEDEYGLGCVAVATVSYSMDGSSRGDRRLETLSSGGLYGIDTESNNEYRHEIELDELANLSAHLQYFGMYYTPSQLNDLR